ncbi:hypothetical protein [Streptomyces sp. TLI_171]|uniref:hypothetical protein n=1 Tax=Streptomyces sp. TLI_171 TaxID=1938859 RepID=UPI00217E8CD9|nr:hypothetical protein [Streptomyces sp. TLI_171]
MLHLLLLGLDGWQCIEEGGLLGRQLAVCAGAPSCLQPRAWPEGSASLPVRFAGPVRVPSAAREASKRQ